MVLVNGDEFPTFELDTKQSIITRIAAVMGTLPKYLYFPNGLPEDLADEDNILVEDLLSLIKKNAASSLDFKKFLTSIRKKIPNKMNIEQDILYPWLAYNTEMERLYKISSIILTQNAEPLVEAGYFDTVTDVERFWKQQRDTEKRNLERAIKTNKREDKNAEKLYGTFQKIEDGAGYTDFVTDRVTLRIELDLKDITLLEIFNHVLLNENVPFATAKNYYKILKDYIPPEEWAQSAEDHLLLKISEKVFVESNRYKDFTDVLLSVDGNVGDEKVTATMKLNTQRGFLKRDQFIQRFLGVFRGLGDIQYRNMSETEVVGIFYFPYQRINTYVFADLVMNNPLFSALINIDESSKATKKKSDLGQPWLHIHFNHPSTGRVTAGITQKIVDRSDAEMRETDEEIFEHGQPYIRVRVRGRDRRSVEVFQEMLSKLFVIYEENYEEIVLDYEQYIPDFGTVMEYDVKPLKKKPEIMAPDVFVKNYSRNCPDNRIPTIVSKKKANKYRNNGKHQVMVFPRSEQKKAPHYESDGVNQKYYVCKNPEYPYPGVRVNKLSNSREYPFVPCCFKEDRGKRKGGNYRQYFFNEEPETHEKRQQELIGTDKILNPDQYGVLPATLEKLFSIIDTETNYKYIRVGVHRNRSSFLNAVMVALHEQTGILELNDSEERDARLYAIREEMSTNNLAPLARQCSYDIPIKELQREIAEPDIYFDPKKYIQLLESYFNCNIFLFNRERMILPNHIQSYYKNYLEAPCVFIYEHMGSESDHAKYPQCELIIRWNTKKSDDTQYLFPFEQKVSRGINKIFHILRESYALNEAIGETVFSWPDEVGIKSQVLDSYGKTRRVDIVYQGQVVSLLTSPIAPIATDEIVSSDVIKTTGQRALDLVKVFGAQLISQTISGRAVTELNAMVGTVLLTIPIEPTAPFPNVPSSSQGMHYPESEFSAIKIYNRNKKLARYITEYSFWLFSKYMKQKSKEVITDKLLTRFAKKTLKIIPDFQYGEVQKKFSLQSGVMDNGRLVVTSEDMMKRLMYVLKMYSIRDLRSLLTYHTRNVITHYYVDLTDFQFSPRQVILYGDDSVDKWIQENKFTYVLHDKISVGQRSPYFFKNTLVKDRVFLAQNVQTLNNAFEIASTWQRRGYNPGPHLSTRKTYNFTLYNYVNENDITVRHVRGKKSPRNTIRILGYKLSGMPYYTVLLELE